MTTTAAVTYNPRYLAFMRATGREGVAVELVTNRRNNADFMGFISQCKQSAPAAILTATGGIHDHDGFTAHVEAVADAMRAKLACSGCGDLICGCPDAIYSGALEMAA